MGIEVDLEQRIIDAIDPKWGVKELSMVQSALASILIQTCRIVGMDKEDMLDSMDRQWDLMKELDSGRKDN